MTPSHLLVNLVKERFTTVPELSLHPLQVRQRLVLRPLHRPTGQRVRLQHPVGGLYGSVVHRDKGLQLELGDHRFGGLYSLSAK